MSFPRNSLETPNKGQVLLAGGFLTAGAGNPATFFGNIIKSVTRTGAGALTVVLKDQFKNLDMYAVFAQLGMAAPSQSMVVVKAYDKAAASLTLETWTGAAAADIAAAADNRVFLLFVMRYGNVPEGAGSYDA